MLGNREFEHCKFAIKPGRTPNELVGFVEQAADPGML